MKINGLYIISEEYFNDMEEPFLKINKKENRPHYYCIKDVNGLLWMIPLSSKIEKYENIIKNKIKKFHNCDILHIAEFKNGKKSVFLIQDIFPITKKYVEREYTINKKHFIVKNSLIISDIYRKVKKVIKMKKHGVKFNETQADINKIIQKLSK